MATLIAVVVTAFLVLIALSVWTTHGRMTRVENFLEHLEGRIILLQKAEFSRQLIQAREQWREDFEEDPPESLANDVRMAFEVFPPFKQCEAELKAIFRAAPR